MRPAHARNLSLSFTIDWADSSLSLSPSFSAFHWEFLIGINFVLAAKQLAKMPEILAMLGDALSES